MEIGRRLRCNLLLPEIDDAFFSWPGFAGTSNSHVMLLAPLTPLGGFLTLGEIVVRGPQALVERNMMPKVSTQKKQNNTLRDTCLT